MKRSLLVLTAGLAWLVATAAGAQAAGQIGDAAAPLDISEWIKGDAVDLAAVKGKKIVVVEFWATWCGPCRTSIPHLTELQKKFQDRDVIFIGVSDEEPAKVRTFVDNMGAKMDYTVAVDRDRKTSAGYMRAYGINGIPHAFVVDKEGKVAWHGHPMNGLDKVLERIAAKTFDLGTESKRAAAQQKLQEYFELAARGGDAGELERLGVQVTALDKEVGGIEPGEKLDLAGVRKLARFQTLMRDYQVALGAGKSDAELAALEKSAMPFAPEGFKFDDFKSGFQMQRVFQEYYRAVTRKGDPARIKELGLKLEQGKSDNAEMLNEMAWTLLTDERIKTRDLALALHLAKAAFKAADGRDVSVLDTYARALFDNGQYAEAVRHQKRAIELCEDPSRRVEFEDNLKRYQAGKPSAN